MGQEQLSLLRRIFGHNPNSIPEEQWPGMAKAWEEVQRENPDASKVNRIEPMGWLTKMLLPEGTAGQTGPFGNIMLNKEAFDKDPNLKLGGILSHETSHTPQGPLDWLKSKFGTDAMKAKIEEGPINVEAAYNIKRDEIERQKRNRLRAGGGG